MDPGLTNVSTNTFKLSNLPFLNYREFKQHQLPLQAKMCKLCISYATMMYYAWYLWNSFPPLFLFVFLKNETFVSKYDL